MTAADSRWGIVRARVVVAVDQRRSDQVDRAQTDGE
jgi:hypothetical protein